MKNKISAVKTRKNNVTSPQIPFVTTVQNIIYDNNYNVNDILGIIKINTEGSIKQQLDNLDNKIDNASLHLTDAIKQQIMQAVCDAYPAAEDIRFITIYDENMVVQNGILIHQSEDFNITQNGIYDITTKSKINVNIQPSFQSKTTTENGLITPDEGYDGLSGVTVNVPIETHLQSSKIVTTNGSVVPDSEYNGLLEVIVNVQPTFQSKTVTKNGTYAPDEGYNGISNITINVRDDITTMPLTITQNGTYKASNENVDAFDEITVEVPNSYTADDENKVVQYGELTKQINRGTVRQNGIYDTSYNDSIEIDVDGSPAVLDTLTVTKNGFFLPKYGYDGFSSVVVNIPNGFTGDDNGKVVYNGALVKQTSRTVTENGTYDTTLNNELKVKVPGSTGSAKHDGTPNTTDGNKPGGAGSAVVGTDPETGEEVVVGVDKDGNIVQTQIPYGIKIVTPPTKTAYTYQETMDYTGIGVKLTNKNGDTYTDVDHPSGWYVNPADLIFPVEKAPAASGGGSGASGDVDVGIVQPIPFTSSSGWYDWRGGRRQFTVSGINAYTQIISGNTVFTLAASVSRSGFWHGTGGSLPDSTVDFAPGMLEVTINGQTAYYWVGTDPNLGISDLSPNAQLNGSAVDWARAGWILCYGAITEGTATIPVKWTNPYTGVVVQDTFEITSTAAPGDAHTSTSSSGTEGSGGGGTF